jgi:hypothetical protein
MPRFLALSFARPSAVPPQPVPHAACQIWLRSLEQGLDLVWHPAARTMHPLPSRAAMKIVSFIECRQRDVIERILRHCGLWPEPLRDQRPRTARSAGASPQTVVRPGIGPRSRVGGGRGDPVRYPSVERAEDGGHAMKRSRNTDTQVGLSLKGGINVSAAIKN